MMTESERMSLETQGRGDRETAYRLMKTGDAEGAEWWHARADAAYQRMADARERDDRLKRAREHDEAEASKKKLWAMISPSEKKLTLVSFRVDPPGGPMRLYSIFVKLDYDDDGRCRLTQSQLEELTKANFPDGFPSGTRTMVF
jgi:hypothetical protein